MKTDYEALITLARGILAVHSLRAQPEGSPFNCLQDLEDYANHIIKEHKQIPLLGWPQPKMEMLDRITLGELERIVKQHDPDKHHSLKFHVSHDGEIPLYLSDARLRAKEPETLTHELYTEGGVTYHSWHYGNFIINTRIVANRPSEGAFCPPELREHFAMPEAKPLTISSVTNPEGYFYKFVSSPYFADFKKLLDYYHKNCLLYVRGRSLSILSPDGQTRLGTHLLR